MADDYGYQKVSTMIDLIKEGRTPVVTLKGIDKGVAFSSVVRLPNGLVKGEGDHGELYFEPSDVLAIFARKVQN